MHDPAQHTQGRAPAPPSRTTAPPEYVRPGGRGGAAATASCDVALRALAAGSGTSMAGVRREVFATLTPGIHPPGDNLAG